MHGPLSHLTDTCQKLQFSARVVVCLKKPLKLFFWGIRCLQMEKRLYHRKVVYIYNNDFIPETPIKSLSVSFLPDAKYV